MGVLFAVGVQALGHLGEPQPAAKQGRHLVVHVDQWWSKLTSASGGQLISIMVKVDLC